MAQGLRAQTRGLSALGFAALCAAGCAPAQEPAPGDPQALGRAEVARILERHHGPLRGTFANALLRLSEGTDAAPTEIALAMPEDLRVDRPGEGVDLWHAGAARRCVKGAEPRALEGDELQALNALRDHVRALLLLPLYAAKGATLTAADRLQLALDNGESWQVDFDPATHQVRALRGPSGTTEFVEVLATRVAVQPKTVALEGIGRRTVQIVANDLYFDPHLFEDPFVAIDPAARPMRPASKALGDPRERPPVPELQDLPEVTALVLDDPGDWPGRCALLGKVGPSLFERGQAPVGLPVYLRESEHALLLVCFRAGDPKAAPFVARDGERIRAVPAVRAAVLAPAAGTWDAALATGRARLEEFLARNGLTAAGPLRVIPFVEPTTPPDAAQQAALSLRLEQPVAPR